MHATSPRFASQYTYEVLYKTSPTAEFKAVGKDNLSNFMLSSAVQYGSPVRGMEADGKPRLMVDDLRGMDATMLTRTMANTETADWSRIPADERAQLGPRPSFFDKVVFMLTRQGALKEEGKLDHLRFYFTKGADNQPTLQRVALDTRSQRLLGIARQPVPAEEEQAGTDAEGAAAQTDATPDPLAALRQSFGLTREHLEVNPFAANGAADS